MDGVILSGLSDTEAIQYQKVRRVFGRMVDSEYLIGYGSCLNLTRDP